MRCCDAVTATSSWPVASASQSACHGAAHGDPLEHPVTDITRVEPHALGGADLPADQALAGGIAPVDEEIVGPLAQIGPADADLAVIDDAHIEVLAHLDLKLVHDNGQHRGGGRHRC